MQSSMDLLPKEINHLHKFAVTWFTRKLQKSTEILSDACSGYFHSIFQLILPSSVVLPRDQLIKCLATEHRTYDNGFEICIHAIQIWQEHPPQSFFVSYQEWPWHNSKVSVRSWSIISSMNPIYDQVTLPQYRILSIYDQVTLPQ